MFCAATATAQRTALPDSGRFLLYLWYKPVGEETYTVTRQGGQRLIDVRFQYEDRGTRVPMESRLELSDRFALRSFTLTGKPGRFSVINDSFSTKGEGLSLTRGGRTTVQKSTRKVFPHYTSAPASLYLFLVKYWEASGRPASIYSIPDGTPVRIAHAGVDSFSRNGKTLVLHRYRMERERFLVRYLWLDADGALAGIAAGFLSTINAKYSDLLHEFRTRTARYTLLEFPVPQPENSLVIRNARLVDIETGTVTGNAVIHIQRGVIAWAGPASEAPVIRKGKTLDAAGGTVLPGLWDMHQHYNSAVLGPALIGMGITSVRDCANQDDFLALVKRSIDQGESIGPQIYRAGLIDGSGPNMLGTVAANSPAEGREAVRRYHRAGYDQIKVYNSVKPAVLGAICAEARALRLPVVGHVPRGMSVGAVLDSGMTGLSHINNVMAGFDIDSSSYTIDYAKPVNAALLARLKATGAVIDPTCVFLELARRPLAADIRALYPDVDTWPRFMATDIRTYGSPADTIAKYRFGRRQPLYGATLLRMLRAGIPVVAGTDLQPFPGYPLYRELELYVQGGFTPLEALETATSIPARVMGSKAGTLRAGATADIIIVEGDPLTRIGDLRRVRWVIRGGQLYDAPRLRRALGFGR
ncbi:hypothetical protein GCM10023184_30400 [Flaviaesturariibacter amylovorans]|uniref:Amidohydrolase 3 domain-containing protein n=1 Tax=Flaviaesturariibacter amylovorans TaxID=1084520 RepID=A0ABP8H7S2_9BACT